MFAKILVDTCVRTKKIGYLNEAISVSRDIYKTCPPQTTGRTMGIQQLIMHLTMRWKVLRHRQDLDEIMQLYPVLVDEEHWQAHQRLERACSWAVAARLGAHPSTSVAYEKAMSLLQDTLIFSPTLQTQHFLLVGKLAKTGWMPLDYASYQIDKGQLKQAIETLERGRSLLWSEMRGLRTSTDQLRTVDPAIANKFTEINRTLETVATTVAQAMNIAVDNNAARGSQGLDPFGNLLMQQRKLLEVRGSLISLIQTLPGFENFLKPPPFDFLNSAASRGPVILINQSQWSSDIVILLKDSPPSLISTPSDFHVRANRLKEQLLSSRKDKGLDSRDYDLTLASVLADLYELVGKPVFERLRKLEVPEKSRVWWCPTSAFCSLPLHAMGPIPSYDDKKVYFMDLYIPSYTQSLAALIESRKPGSHPQTFDKPSFLLVAQPETLPGALGEINVIEALVSPVTSLVSEMATPTTVIEGLRDHRFAHFISHGLLETGKPFDASFELHKGGRLTLLEIVRSHLPAAEFAFLSACHTAELTDDSIADEGLHLAAAVQYCGFRSVVGTMWAMADADGKDLSKYFYKSVFSDSARRRGVPYYERSAKALRDAVKKLRRKRGITLERWVNFVHYGA
ncbi:CHAT domain containing protein [Lactarius tabidus]